MVRLLTEDTRLESPTDFWLFYFVQSEFTRDTIIQSESSRELFTDNKNERKQKLNLEHALPALRGRENFPRLSTYSYSIGR